MPAPVCTLPYPTNAAGQAAQPTLSLSAIGATGPSAQYPPLRVFETLLKWLRYHFADAANIVYPDLQGRVWTDTDSTPIVIQSLAEFDPAKTAERPAVLVQPYGVAPVEPRSINNQRLGGCGVGNTRQLYARLWKGRFLVHCVGGREGEAFLLAAEVADELDGYAPVVRPALCLERLEMVGIDQRRRLEEHKDTWTMPVGLEYAFWRSREITPLDAADITGTRVTTST